MFFVIAGIQPKTVVVEGAGQCPSCGLHQTGFKRQDHYFSLFFLPLFRVKKGVPYLECKGCGSLSSESGESYHTTQGTTPQCRFCGMSVEPTFRFCPHCGKPFS